MNAQPLNGFKTSVGYLVFVLIVLTTPSCSRSPSYNDFIARDQEFFEELAQACDQLLSETNIVKLKPYSFPVASVFSVSPDDANLPRAIQNLRPTKIHVDRCDAGISNCLTFVWIKVGISGAGYGIRWSTNTSSVWELSVGGGEAGGDVVYTRH